MKVHSLYGPKEIPWKGQTFVTDENDDADVPDELGKSLLEQVDAWASVKASRKSDKEGEG